MSYAKVWRSLWKGSMAGKPALQLVWIYMLANSDANGVVDESRSSIAGATGLSLADVSAAVDELEAPDRNSRTPDEDGRRIVRVDPRRDWGWIVVNYPKYREMRNDDDRKRQVREATRRWRDQKRSPNDHGDQPVITCDHGEITNDHGEPKTEDRRQNLEPESPLATLVEIGACGPVVSESSLESSSPAGPAESAGAGNGASSGASGGRDTAAGLRTVGSILGGISARLGMLGAQEGPQRRAVCASDAEHDSEAKAHAQRALGPSVESRAYVDPVYELAKPRGGAVASLALSLCGKLWNHGLTSVPLLRGIVRHWLDRRDEIRNPWAYYGPGGPHWPGLSRECAALDAIADHREQELATWRFVETLR